MICIRHAIAAFAVLLLSASVSPCRAENIDPDMDGSQYAWAENAGWINGQPSEAGGPGVEVGPSGLSGWMWGENVGWISLSCTNTAGCGTVAYGVTNNGMGQLAGYAWSENIGWLSFSCTNTGSCGASQYGVTIDPLTGLFQGEAWSENIGWVSFSLAGQEGSRMRTSCVAPAGTPALLLGDLGAAQTELSWSVLPGATTYDVIRGDLGMLRSSGGDYSAATLQCVIPGVAGTATTYVGDPAAGDGFFFLVRGIDCMQGSYDSGGSEQSSPRDSGIEDSGNDCV